MSKKDFDYLVIASERGWRMGRGTSVAIDEEGRLSLASYEEIDFPKEVIEMPLGPPLDCDGNPYQGKHFGDSKRITVNHLIGMGFDRANNLHVIDGGNCRVHQYSSQEAVLRPLRYVGGCGARYGEFAFFSSDKKVCVEKRILSGGIAFGKSTLYVADTFNDRVQAFHLPSFQIKFILSSFVLSGKKAPGLRAFDAEADKLCRPTEVLTTKRGNLYILDSGNARILKVNRYGVVAKVIGGDREPNCSMGKPTSMAVADGYLYVLDGEHNKILKFPENGDCHGTVVDLSKTIPGIKATTLAIDGHKILHVGDGNEYGARRSPECDSAAEFRIHEFDRIGRYLGYLVAEKRIWQLKTDHDGKLYGLCDDLSSVVSFAGGKRSVSQGSYRTEVLDSQNSQCNWHRLELAGENPENTRLEVYGYAAEETFDPGRINDQSWQRVLSSPYENVARKDALFENLQGRYLALRLEFSGDGKATPSVGMARCYFQRDSYLRYLPATYQEDEGGRYFLERFLSVFETMALGLEVKIADVAQYWDVDAVGEEFLGWLGSWVALTADDNWSQEKKRKFLAQAFDLYKARGTVKGLRRIIRIFTEGEVQIIEHFRLRPPMVVGRAAIVGVNAFVGARPTQRLILGESSRIGSFVLTETEDSPEKPFEHDAYDFTVLADTSKFRDEGQVQALRRLIELEAPAHTRFFLRTSHGTRGELGKRRLLGVDTRLAAGYEPMVLGKSSIIGGMSPVGHKTHLKGTLGVRSRLGLNTVLH